MALHSNAYSGYETKNGMDVTKDYQDYLILDGPGGTAEKVDERKWIQQGREPNPKLELEENGREKIKTKHRKIFDLHIMAGDYEKSNTEEGTLHSAKVVPKLKGPKIPLIKKRVHTYAIKKTSKPVTANATGHGMSENAEHAYKVIKKVCNDGKRKGKIKRINMIGWSRGAVTCFKIADRLYEDNEMKGKEVNIFAIDPVAGPGHRNDKRGSTIQKNVKNLVITLANHERRSFFLPQDQKRLQIGTGTNYIWLPYPGVHNTQPMPRKNDEGVLISSQYPGMIVAQLAYNFLKKNGTIFKGNRTRKVIKRYLSDIDMLIMYNRMLMDERAWRACGKKFYDPKLNVNVSGGKGEWRGFWKRHLGDYVTFPEVFVNEHHLFLFKHIWPDVYKTLYGGREESTLRKATANVVWEQLGIDTPRPVKGKSDVVEKKFWGECWYNYIKKIKMKDVVGSNKITRQDTEWDNDTDNDEILLISNSDGGFKKKKKESNEIEIRILDD